MSYGYLMGVPGRKAWDLHSHENISSQEYVKSLIRIYQEYPALYEYDPLRASFEWINGMDAESSVLRFMRKSPSEIICYLYVTLAQKRKRTAR